MKKMITLFLTISLLVGCSFQGGGFKAGPRYYKWRLHNAEELYGARSGKSLYDYALRTSKDMRSCGMDPILGEGGDGKVNLCLEGKGWYLEGGPVCENKLLWNDPACIKWRSKNSKPDVQPWI